MAEPDRPTELPPAPPQPAPAAPEPHRSGPVLLGLALALLAGGIFVLWLQQQQFADAAATRSELAGLREQLRALQQRPAPAPAPAPPADLRPLESRLAALEARPAAEVAPDSGRLAALESRLAAAEQQTARAARLLRLQRAAAALAAGQALGDLPGAPPALARYAAAAPPTELALRRDFPDAAARAEAASRPPADDSGIAARIWHRLSGLVTLRQGETVLYGTPASVALSQARWHVETGDLASALADLAALDPAAAAAIAPWRARAESLLAARAALAAMPAD